MYNYQNIIQTQIVSSKTDEDPLGWMISISISLFSIYTVSNILFPVFYN